MVQDKVEDAGGLTPVKDGNAALRLLAPRTFARYFDDCYRVCSHKQSNAIFEKAALNPLGEHGVDGIPNFIFHMPI